MNDAQSLREKYFDLAARGQAEAALQAAQELAEVAPDQPTSHYARGEAFAALGRHEEAGAAFADALRLAPRWADAWVNLGLARYRLGALWEAKAAMREALHNAPDHPAAKANLGALLRITGETERGEDLLRQSLEAAPGNYAARLNVAAEWLQVDRGADVLALLDEAPSLPRDRDVLRAWRLARSLALLQTGRFSEAKEELAAFEAIGPVPPELTPLWLWRRTLLADFEGRPADAVAAVTAMEAAVETMGPLALPEHRIIAHYNIARFWVSRGQRARAFAHWSAGHAILKVSQPFRRETAREFIDTQVAIFDAARFRGPRADNNDPAPVFIVGMPRSGTTLCEQILASHARVHGAGERGALPEAFIRLGAAKGIADLDQAGLDAAAAAYLAELRAVAPAKTRIVDKLPGNELYLGLVGRMLPGAKIIHCVRDPRDIGLSIWTYRFFGEHPYAHDLADLGWTIASRSRLMAHWRDVLPNPILTVALADWVNDFDATLARVLAHLDLPHDPACARFHENDREVRTASRSQVRQPINALGLGRWRMFETELAPLIEELRAGGMLEAEPEVRLDPPAGPLVGSN